MGARAVRLSRVLSPFLSARLDVRGRTRHEEERQRRHDLIQCREWTSPKMEGLALWCVGFWGEAQRGSHTPPRPGATTKAAWDGGSDGAWRRLAAVGLHRSVCASLVSGVREETASPPKLPKTAPASPTF